MFKSKLLKITNIILLMIGIIYLSGCSSKAVEKSFPEEISELKSYKLEATIQTFFQNGNKEANVVVYFKEPNLYRVELTNSLVNEKQIMIKNDKGVFVILPSINKTFKINSNWPTNNNQPFLLESISKNLLHNDELKTTKENGQTTIELKTKIFDNVEPVTEKIIFDNKTKLPKEIYLYRTNNELFNHVKFNSIEKNVEINSDLFIVDNTITSSRLDYIKSPIEFDRAITYPTFCPENTKLFQETILGGANDKTAIIKFSGDNPFTLLECYIDASEVLKQEYFYGDIYIMSSSFALVANDTVKFYSSGIEYTLASNKITLEDIFMIAESLGTSDIK